VRKVPRETWEIAKIWWLVVPGGALGFVAIVKAVEGAHGKSIWFWGFWAMTALMLAVVWRLRAVLKERDAAIAALANENTRDAVAHRLDRYTRELETLRGEIPAERTGPGPVVTNEQRDWGESAVHLTERVLGELRQNAPGFVSYWRTEPELRPYPTLEGMEADADFALGQLRHMAQRLREGHDEPWAHTQSCERGGRLRS
jgi:hypothetical protein